MKRISIFSILCIFLVLMAHQVFAGTDDWVVEYPDGDYGIDMGGGYEEMPDRHGGEVLPPKGYREDYMDTQYGPLVQDKFLIFPDFEFPEDKKKEEEEDKETKDLIFHESTTTTSQSSLWGVYIPGSDE